MERIAKARYEGTLKPGELDDAHILRTYQELTKATGQGYGNRFTTILNDQGEPSPEVLKMRQNLYKFSMVKDYAMLEELNGYLSGGNEMMRWEEFRDMALQLNKKYNLNYLQAEWQTALQAGKFASLWEEYERNKGLFPSLRYRTQGDDQVRKEHEKLDGIVKPIEDPFWSSYYPPNGWRCRCYVIQTAEHPTTDKDMPTIGPEDVSPEFKTNVGKGGEVFKETNENKGKPHPFFALAKTADSETKKAFEYAKLAAKPHTVYKGKNGGSIKLNIFADRSDLLGNYRTAKTIVDNIGIDVELRPNINIPGHKNPEFGIMGAQGDQTVKKTKDLRAFVTNSFNSKFGNNGQLKNLDKTVLLLELGNSTYSKKELIGFAAQIKPKMQKHKNLTHLFIKNRNKVVIIERGDVEGNALFEKVLGLNK